MEFVKSFEILVNLSILCSNCLFMIISWLRFDTNLSNYVPKNYKIYYDRQILHIDISIDNSRHKYQLPYIYIYTYFYNIYIFL